ncbi:AI-2E family transporter [Pseudohoeflea coraliihabitans]|uniref:AI-2E family transporter n=1 Tax=Pseudohoeflea coraliihabitans TaxID=2860393 RepID=A0ABS6WNC2_9HYPH|nr:AI-2E family transporter [Pseudohoeflea sp. DP4N28-3]MBW3097280.1 AI-2E family transporter [Pseudohoeflea sp. DP4N28-3]
MRYERLRPPIVRLPPKTGLDKILSQTATISLILLGLLGLNALLYFGEAVLSPVALALVVGLMFGPFADRLERLGLPPPLSAAVVVLTFLILLMFFITGFAVPLSDWVNRLPLIWQRVQSIIADWQGVMDSVSSLGAQLKDLTGAETKMEVTVDDTNAAAEIAFLAPGIIGGVLIFLASLYFYLSSRHAIRAAVLRLCMTRRLRWRMAHIFRDAETLVSRYLISITIINVGLGVLVSMAMFALGVPSPFLWGLLAASLNYIIYIGPALMALILLAVGLATYSTMPAMFYPMLTYLLLNFVEAQFITPSVLGRQLTISPFIVFLTVIYWLWMWGPIGGFVAVPLLLVVAVTINHILPLMPLSGVEGAAPKPKRSFKLRR